MSYDLPLMPSPNFVPKLSPRFAVYLRDYLLDRNIDPRPIFAECGIAEVRESESALPIATTKVIELFDLAAAESDDSLLGFNLARNYHYESSAVIILAMLAAPTVVEAIETLGLFDKYVDSGIAITSDFASDTASFTCNLIGVDGRRSTQLNEYLVTFIVSTFNMATRKAMPLSCVDFQHLRNTRKDKLNQYFNTNVTYGRPENALRFDSSYLKQHMFTSNALLYDILVNALKTYFSADFRQHGFIDSVCRELMRQPEIETTDIKSVAHGLSMSERTLRRRMKQEGFTFREVKRLTRERQTKYYLANTNMPLAEIAYAVGYAELSSFSRAFKRWTGTTPQEYRVMARKLIAG